MRDATPRAGQGAVDPMAAAVEGPIGARGADRTRLDMALATARVSDAAREARSGIPGLRRELFPAAAWRRELEALSSGLRAVHDEKTEREEARVTHLLAEPRAEEILAAARQQARRLVSTAATVAKARRDQAEREAAAAIAEAEKVAARTLQDAELQAAQMRRPGEDIAALNDRLLRLRAALREAEAKLGAFSSDTRRAMAARPGVIDLEEEHERGEFEALVATTEAHPEPVAAEVPTRMGAPDDDGSPGERAVLADEIVAPPLTPPKVRPKGRFVEPGFFPDRIETLRDEQAP